MIEKSEIANALLDIGAVGFRPDRPIKFKTGLLAPIYIDNRKFIFHPTAWRKVIEGFETLLTDLQLKPDVIAGIETAGIPHSSVLGYVLERPTVFVRKKLKDHGTQIPIEGGDVTGHTVLLIEDNISSGSSSMHGVDALRAAGATVQNLFAITDYEFKESSATFGAAGITVHTLTTFSVVLDEAERRGDLSPENHASIDDWFADPWAWAKKGGFE